jgi:hypothetical protein
MYANTTFKTAILATLFAFSLRAHEGHDHDGPSTFQPKKGGVVKSNERINVEAVTKEGIVELYFFDNDGNVKPKDTFTVTADFQLPKSKKKTKLNLEEKTNGDQFSHWVISDGPKKVHRYSLILKIKDSQQDHPDRITFNIEPKK